MYRIELKPGEENVFRTIEELATGIRNGLVTPKARIYHNASQKWLPIEFHPHYKKALAMPAAKAGKSGENHAVSVSAPRAAVPDPVSPSPVSAAPVPPRSGRPPLCSCRCVRSGAGPSPGEEPYADVHHPRSRAGPGPGAYPRPRSRHRIGASGPGSFHGTSDPGGGRGCRSL